MSEAAWLVIAGVVLTAMVTAIGWVIARVLANRESIVKLETRIDDLGKDVSAQLTQECVRDVIEVALSKRDQANEERRGQWDENLSLKIEQAVFKGTKECQSQTRADLELIVPRIVREVLQQTDRHRKVVTAPDGRPA